MSYFFKRRQENEKAQAPLSPPSSPTPEPSSPMREEEQSIPMPEGARTSHEERMRLMSASYNSWHEELTAIAHKGMRPFSERDSAVIDITAAHPTGNAQFTSGQPTLLSSLIREKSALKIARLRLASLLARQRSLADTYGFAPIVQAKEKFTWSELDGFEAHSQDVLAKDSDPWQMAHIQAETQAHTQSVSMGQSPTFLASSASTDARHWQATEKEEGSDGAEGVRQSPARQCDNAPNGEEEKNISPSESYTHVKEMVQPALLRTIRLDPQGEDDAYLTLTSRCDINPEVLSALRRHGVKPEEISRLRVLVNDPAQEAAAISFITALGRAYLPGFAHEHVVLIGAFIHPGHVLVADLEAMQPYIENSGIMAALAGDAATRKLTSAPLPPAQQQDRAPEAERGIGDRDTQELAALEAVASGRSLVIDAPAGSKHVETVAALVADAAASGRSVLYVPGRQGAGQALLDELERAGLRDIALDFSDVDKVARKLRTGLRLRGEEIATSQILANRQKLVNVRNKLETYMHDLHEVNPKWDESVYSVLQTLARLTRTMKSNANVVRLPEKALSRLATSRHSDVEDLHRAYELGMLGNDIRGHVWAGGRIMNQADGEQAVLLASSLASTTLPALISQSGRVASETGLRRPSTFNEWLEQITMIEGVASTLTVFVPTIYQRSAMDMVVATASRQWRQDHGEKMSGKERRALTKAAKDFVRPGVSVGDLHAELLKVQEKRDIWRRYSAATSFPQLPAGMDAIKSTAQVAYSQLRTLEKWLKPGTNLLGMPLEELANLVRALADSSDIMEVLPERNSLDARIREHGLGDFLDELRRQSVPEEEMEQLLELAYYSSIFEDLVKASSAFSKTGPADLEKFSQEYRELDAWQETTLAGPVRNAVVRIMRETITRRREDTIDLDAQLEKYSTGALRDVIARYSRLVQVSRPVWVIPTMMAAEYIPPMPWADIVIMDSADGASLASSVSMLMRGRQIVLVGDSRKADENSTFAQFAAILPICQLPTNRSTLDALATHALIHQGYEDVLTMIPEAPHSHHVHVTYVDGKGIPMASTGAVESTQVEVDAVVNAVVNHALTRPEESLAVVCLSPIHRMRVAEALRSTINRSTVLGVLKDRRKREPFVVVDTTQTQGLTRDSVIVSVGFAKTNHGRVLHSFGNLTTAAGVAGLVETLAAARGDLHIISSLTANDLDSLSMKASGVTLLKMMMRRGQGEEAYIEPTEHQGAATPLIMDIADRLRERGWAVALNYGYSEGMTIPLVVGDYALRGIWRVAVIYDDESYMAESSMRRRERYRMQALKDRGWEVFSTYSTSLFIDVDGQVEKIHAILAREHATVLGAAHALDPHAEVTPEPRTVDRESADTDGDTATPYATPISAQEVAHATGTIEKVVVPPLAHTGMLNVSELEALYRNKEGDSPSPTSSAPIAHSPEATHNRGPQERGPRPAVKPGLPLSAYSDDELDDLLAWICSDHTPRTQEELVEALRSELSLTRRGAHIETVLRNIVARSQAVRTQVDAHNTGVHARITGTFAREGFTSQFTVDQSHPDDIPPSQNTDE